jgi:hypothetical protein
MKYRESASRKSAAITELPKSKNQISNSTTLARISSMLSQIHTSEDPDSSVPTRGVVDRAGYWRARKCAK